MLYCQHMFGPGMFATVALPSVRVLDLSMPQLDDHDVMNIYRFFRQCYLPRLDKLLMQVLIFEVLNNLLPLLGI